MFALHAARRLGLRPVARASARRAREALSSLRRRPTGTHRHGSLATFSLRAKITLLHEMKRCNSTWI